MFSRSLSTSFLLDMHDPLALVVVSSIRCVLRVEIVSTLRGRALISLQIMRVLSLLVSLELFLVGEKKGLFVGILVQSSLHSSEMAGHGEQNDEEQEAEAHKGPGHDDEPSAWQIGLNGLDVAVEPVISAGVVRHVGIIVGSTAVVSSILTAFRGRVVEVRGAV